MKRWKIFLGRGGTVLIAIGLALLLVSLIPSAQLDTYEGNWSIPAKVVEISFYRVLTPQQGLQVTVTANGTLTVYLLEVSTQNLIDWIREHQPELANGYFLNVTRLEAFLEANPDSIGWHKEVSNGKIEYQYVPTKVTNATLIFSNPSSNYITVDSEISVTSLIAPGTRVRDLAQWAIPIGFVLALPWLTQLWKEKTTRRGS